jgi:hypothetical protein
MPGVPSRSIMQWRMIEPAAGLSSSRNLGPTEIEADGPGDDPRLRPFLLWSGDCQAEATGRSNEATYPATRTFPMSQRGSSPAAPHQSSLRA